MERQLFIHRRFIFMRRCMRAGLYSALFFSGGTEALADKLTHEDGTVVEGTIKQETPDQIQITTRHGDFTFEKADIVKIERTSGRAQATPPPTPLVDNSKYIPAGPIDPFKPPQIPPLVRMIPTPAAGAAGTSGTVTASQSAGMPGAAALPTASPSPSPAI
jgi:hypothetical protein